MPTLSSFITSIQPPDIAPDRETFGDQYDMKIDDLRRKIKLMAEEADIKIGAGGSTAKLTHILYVDKNVISVTPDGSLGSPYNTISDAISAIPAVTNSTETRQVWTILISPDNYDEDLVIDGTYKHILLIGNGGPFNLGLYAPGVSNWAPTNARNITWNLNQNNIESVRHSLTIGCTTSPFGGYSTHLAYNSVPRISGKIFVQDNVLGGTTKELYLSCEVSDFSSTGTSLVSTGTGILNCYFDRCRFKTAVNITTGRIQLSNQTRFDGLITCNNFSTIMGSVINSGMTITADIADIQPSGIFYSYLFGTFTGPINSIRLDGYSNWSFITNGAILGGAATKTIQENLIP